MLKLHDRAFASDIPLSELRVPFQSNLNPFHPLTGSKIKSVRLEHSACTHPHCTCIWCCTLTHNTRRAKKVQIGLLAIVQTNKSSTSDLLSSTSFAWSAPDGRRIDSFSRVQGKASVKAGGKRLMQLCLQSYYNSLICGSYSVVQHHLVVQDIYILFLFLFFFNFQSKSDNAYLS